MTRRIIIMTDLPDLQIHSPLTLIIDDKPVGFVKVKNANPRVLVGQFELNPKFKDHHEIFKRAVDLSKKFEADIDAGHATNDILWKQCIDVFEEITELSPRFVELDFEIEEFEIFGDWSINVGFIIHGI